MYFMQDESKRDEVCDRYAKWFELASITNPAVINELERLLGIYRKYGKLNLFCWCAPKRCHSETIKAYLESRI